MTLKFPKPKEDHFEATTIERLKQLHYAHDDGKALRDDDTFPLNAVLLTDLLRRHLRATYPQLPDDAIETAIRIAANPQGADVLHRNLFFHQLLVNGFDVPYKTPLSQSGGGASEARGGGEERHAHIYLINWDEPDKNDFRVVSQLPIQGQNDRRPDLIIYINGLPLVVFELKNPYDEAPTVADAYNQIQHYTVDIPQLFDFNAFCVISDGTTSLHGMHSAEFEWFAPWKTIDGVNVERQTTGSMKTLVEGLFPKDRLLAYLRHFIVFEVVNEVITKKGAKYHQFFGVRFAVEQALRATRPDGDRKIGVIWHTQGSGKSLSMVFFVGILRRRLENPTFVIQVDRNDLDEQLHDNFVAARSLVGDVQHAESVEELHTLLQTEGGGLIFTTIEKFQLREDELQHPVLSTRHNIIVIADEAHRTQYGFKAKLRRTAEGIRRTYGHAYYLRDALPYASRIGFTGTPIALVGRDTQEVFGNIIHTYDIPQAQADNAIKPIYYEPRLVRLHLVNEQIDAELEEVMEDEARAAQESAKWRTIETAAGTKERLAQIAQDILTHFETRNRANVGKAMIVCMSRRIAVDLYEQIIQLRPDWHQPEIEQGQIKIVMTGDITKDPKTWGEKGYLTTKGKREKIKERLKDIADPLKMVIVVDMWLTGTDIPCLHTLYVDKPMKSHNLMQAIARVNRVFRDKQGGLVVDYIGIGHLLKAAAKQYTASGFGEPTQDLSDIAKAQFFNELNLIRAILPNGVTVKNWRSLSNIQMEDLCALLYGTFSTTDEQRDAYLLAEQRVSAAFSLVMHLDDCMPHADEVAFYQMVRAELKKTIPETKKTAERDQAVRDLVDRSIASQGVVDIFKAANIEKPDISILDEKFLEEFKSKEQENLRLKLLSKLLEDEIHLRERKNLAKYGSFKQMLEEILQRYHNNTITAAEVVRTMIQIQQEMRSEDKRKAETGLSDEELAFYDSIAGLRDEAYDMPFLCDLVRDVVESVKRNLRVDWTKPHRKDIRYAVESAVKMVLRRKKIRAVQFQFILNRVMNQAEEMYENWPMVA